MTVSNDIILVELSRAFAKKAEFHRTNQNDPMGINHALYVAMLECASACNEVMMSHPLTVPKAIEKARGGPAPIHRQGFA